MKAHGFPRIGLSCVLSPPFPKNPVYDQNIQELLKDKLPRAVLWSTSCMTAKYTYVSQFSGISTCTYIECDQSDRPWPSWGARFEPNQLVGVGVSASPKLERSGARRPRGRWRYPSASAGAWARFATSDKRTRRPCWARRKHLFFCGKWLFVWPWKLPGEVTVTIPTLRSPSDQSLEKGPRYWHMLEAEFALC